MTQSVERTADAGRAAAAGRRRHGRRRRAGRRPAASRPPGRRHRRGGRGRRRGSQRLADPEPLPRVRLADARADDRDPDARPRRLLRARPGAPPTCWHRASVRCTRCRRYWPSRWSTDTDRLVVGTMGGHVQPQILTQVLLAPDRRGGRAGRGRPPALHRRRLGRGRPGRHAATWSPTSTPTVLERARRVPRARTRRCQPHDSRVGHAHAIRVSAATASTSAPTPAPTADPESPRVHADGLRTDADGAPSAAQHGSGSRTPHHTLRFSAVRRRRHRNRRRLAVDGEHHRRTPGTDSAVTAS